MAPGAVRNRTVLEGAGGKEMTEEICPSPKYCEVALKLEEIRGEINSQLSSGTEIMRSLKASQDGFNTRVEKILEKQDQRIVLVEKKVWWASGAAAGAASAITGAITFMVTWMKLKNGGGGGG